MEELTLKIKVADDLEAYKVVSRLSFIADISEASYKTRQYKFDVKDETKLPRHFLRSDFGNKSILNNE